MARLSNSQVLTITRAVVLLNQFGGVLSDHEQNLILELGRRFKRLGRETSVTFNEWPVIEEALGAMEAVRRDRQAARSQPQPNTAPNDAAGVGRGLSNQPAA